MAGWLSALLALALPLLSGITAFGGELAPWRPGIVPALVLDRLDGPRTDLAAFRGRPVIVHFFATWCAPCLEEMASLNALAAAPDASAILAVNVGETEARLRNVLRQPSFPVLLDPARAATRAWQVDGLPTSFVLDSDLAPALRTEAPLDWSSPAVTAALSALMTANARTPREGSPEDDQPP